MPLPIQTLAHHYASAYLDAPASAWDSVYHTLHRMGYDSATIDTDLMEDAITDAASELYPGLV